MTASDVIRLGTRGSQLALTQSRQVAAAFEALHPGVRVELEIIRTKGDRITDVPLSRIGDKGLFTKELEVALLEGRIDFAVHSMKDMPTTLPEGLIIGAVPLRKPPFDGLITLTPGGFETLPTGARVATGSLRRRAQLRHARPDLVLEEMRGNVPTRIGKLVEHGLDGIILALAGLSRLGVPEPGTDESVEFVVPDAWDEGLAGARVFISAVPAQVCIPAVGQGALCLEAREGDKRVLALLGALDDRPSHAEVRCERAIMRALEGGCQVPIAAWATHDAGRLKVRAMVASLDGGRRLEATAEGMPDEAEHLGRTVADALRRQGAGDILDEIRVTGGADPLVGGEGARGGG